jgi:hypothetical protein
MANQVGTKKKKNKAMSLVIAHLLVRPYTSALLVQKIGIYSSSHINSCLSSADVWVVTLLGCNVPVLSPVP